MNGMRWTTGIGIAVGGTGGALAALMGAPKAPPPPASALDNTSTVAAPSLPAEGPDVSPPAAAVPSGDAPALPVAPSASVAASSAAAQAPSPPAAVVALELPTTRAALLKAELYCDQRKDFDECARAAQAHETGTAGGANVIQAKRFRRIALTHLVGQCESGSPHACFVLAAKYRLGHELTKNLAGAEALEKRATELCRIRNAPECPPPQ